MMHYFLEHDRYFSLIGIAAILATAVLFSEKRSKINLKLIGSAFIMQIMLAVFILKTSIGGMIFHGIARGVEQLYQFAQSGSNFVFGSLADASGPWGVVFCIKVAPIIIFFGAFMALLYHLGIIQFLVKGITLALCPLLGTSGAETLCAAANSMFGQTEAPLLVKHYLPNMTRSEVLVVMISGMATLSGSLLAVYGALGVPMLHLLSSSFMAIPGSILISKILIPETEKPETLKASDLVCKKTSSNILDAISTGTSDGLGLAVNVMAMLIAFISIIAMINAILSASTGLTLDFIFGKMFATVARMLSISSSDSTMAGTLLGQKLAINEFVAYANFATAKLSERGQVILTYALCGFANFSSIGIQIGGIGALVPSKRELITRLGLIALLGGTLTNLLNAAIASLLI